MMFKTLLCGLAVLYEATKPTAGFDCPSASCSNSPCDCNEIDLNCRSNTCQSNGCAQCISGYWKQSNNDKCIPCKETFGEECDHCTDFLGCNQCASGYTRTKIDDCGDVHYCEPNFPSPTAAPTCSIDDTNVRLLFEDFEIDSVNNEFCVTYELIINNDIVDDNGCSFYSGLSDISEIEIDFSCDNGNSASLTDYLASFTPSGVSTINNNILTIDTTTNGYEYTLCFDRSLSNNVDQLTSAEFCADDGTCGIINIPDICGSTSTRIPTVFPTTYPIELVPVPGKLYDLDDDGNPDTFGTLHLRDDLVVLRGWWIKECIVESGEMKVVLEDSYIDGDLVNDDDIEDAIFPPIQLPIYDRTISPDECWSLQGVITNYDEDVGNGELSLIVNLGASPASLFQNSSFGVNKGQFITSDILEDNEGVAETTAVCEIPETNERFILENSEDVEYIENTVRPRVEANGQHLFCFSESELGFDFNFDSDNGNNIVSNGINGSIDTTTTFNDAQNTGARRRRRRAMAHNTHNTYNPHNIRDIQDTETNVLTNKNQRNLLDTDNECLEENTIETAAEIAVSVRGGASYVSSDQTDFPMTFSGAQGRLKCDWDLIGAGRFVDIGIRLVVIDNGRRTHVFDFDVSASLELSLGGYLACDNSGVDEMTFISSKVFGNEFKELYTFSNVGITLYYKPNIEIRLRTSVTDFAMTGSPVMTGTLDFVAQYKRRRNTNLAAGGSGQFVYTQCEESELIPPNDCDGYMLEGELLIEVLPQVSFGLTTDETDHHSFKFGAAMELPRFSGAISYPATDLAVYDTICAENEQCDVDPISGAALASPGFLREIKTAIQAQARTPEILDDDGKDAVVVEKIFDGEIDEDLEYGPIVDCVLTEGDLADACCAVSIEPSEEPTEEPTMDPTKELIVQSLCIEENFELDESPRCVNTPCGCDGEDADENCNVCVDGLGCVECLGDDDEAGNDFFKQSDNDKCVTCDILSNCLKCSHYVGCEVCQDGFNPTQIDPAGCGIQVCL